MSAKQALGSPWREVQAAKATHTHRWTGHIKPQRVGQEGISESPKDEFDPDYRLIEPRQLSQ